VSSSIWSSLKAEYQTILDNSYWLISNGQQVGFWTDQWCGGEPLAYSYQVSDVLIKQLPPKVCDYIDNFRWKISLVSFGFYIYFGW